MKIRLFNTPFEMGLRMILLLSASPKNAFSVDRIVGLDFITSYAADFSLPYGNLHGDNHLKYGEIVSRRLLVQEAVKDLVTRGVLNVTVNRGYIFSISESGMKYARTLKSEYAKTYKEIAKEVIKRYEDETDAGILSTIQSYSIQSLKG